MTRPAPSADPALMTGIAAVAQPFGRDIEETFARIELTLADARDRSVDLVVFPECAIGGYMRQSSEGQGGPDLPHPLEADGPEMRRLVSLAGDTTVCIGYTEAGPGGSYSSAVCVTGDGILGHHRKVHLPPAERFAYTAGDSFAAFDTPVGRVGMLLCYDKLFPEATRALVLDGAQIVACMAAWPMDRHQPAATARLDRQTRHFSTVAAARAVENQVVWVSSNQTGDWGSLRFLGHAQIVDPDGIVRARTTDDPGVAVAHLDVAAEIDAMRIFIDHLADRRPASYGLPTAGGVDASVGAFG